MFIKDLGEFTKHHKSLHEKDSFWGSLTDGSTNGPFVHQRPVGRVSLVGT